MAAVKDLTHLFFGIERTKKAKARKQQPAGTKGGWSESLEKAVLSGEKISVSNIQEVIDSKRQSVTF